MPTEIYIRLRSEIWGNLRITNVSATIHWRAATAAVINLAMTMSPWPAAVRRRSLNTAADGSRMDANGFAVTIRGRRLGVLGNNWPRRESLGMAIRPIAQSDARGDNDLGARGACVAVAMAAVCRPLLASSEWSGDPGDRATSPWIGSIQCVNRLKSSVAVLDGEGHLGLGPYSASAK